MGNMVKIVTLALIGLTKKKMFSKIKDDNVFTEVFLIFSLESYNYNTKTNSNIFKI